MVSKPRWTPNLRSFALRCAGAKSALRSAAVALGLGALLLGACARESDETTAQRPSAADEQSVSSGDPCALFEGIGDGRFVEAEANEWADPSELLTPLLAPWGFDELRAEPAASNTSPDKEWAHHLSVMVRGRSEGALLAIAATDAPRREAAGLLLAVARERIRQRDQKLTSHLALTSTLLAEPAAEAWRVQVAGLLAQRPVSLRRVGVTVFVDSGPEGLRTNRDALRPILEELAEEQGVALGDFGEASVIPRTLSDVGLPVVTLSLDLEPLDRCTGTDASRLQRNVQLLESLLDKLDGALGFDLPDR